MKLLRTLGLATAMATVAMACNGTSSAAAEATELCLNATGACNPPTKVHYQTVEKLTLLNPILNIKCNVLLSGTVTSSSGNPATIEATELSYSNCTFSCAIKPTKLGTILVLQQEVELAWVLGHDFIVNWNCLGFINCNYSSAELAGHGLGPNVTGGPDHITYLEAQVENVSGESCPEFAKLDMLLASLTPIYIR